MFGAISYIPLYSQMALLQSASNSGLILIPFVLSLTIASALSGQIVSRTGKYKLLMIVSAVITSVGMYMLARLSITSSELNLTVGMILLGLGIGGNMPIFIVLVQSSFGHDKLGLVTSSMQLFRNIGATLGTALLGALIINHLEKAIFKISLHDIGLLQVTLTDLPNIFAELQQTNVSAESMLALRESVAQAINGAFLLCTFFCVMVVITVLFLPSIRLRKTNVTISE